MSLVPIKVDLSIYAIPTFVEKHLVPCGKRNIEKSYFVYYTKDRMEDRFNKNKGIETGLMSYRELTTDEKDFFRS